MCIKRLSMTFSGKKCNDIECNMNRAVIKPFEDKLSDYFFKGLELLVKLF